MNGTNARHHHRAVRRRHPHPHAARMSQTRATARTQKTGASRTSARASALRPIVASDKSRVGRAECSGTRVKRNHCGTVQEMHCWLACALRPATASDTSPPYRCCSTSIDAHHEPTQMDHAYTSLQHPVRTTTPRTYLRSLNVSAASKCRPRAAVSARTCTAS